MQQPPQPAPVTDPTAAARARRRKEDEAPLSPRKKGRQDGPAGDAPMLSLMAAADPEAVGAGPGDEQSKNPNDPKGRTLAKRLGPQHHAKLRLMISGLLRTNVIIKKKMWYQEAHQFFNELPPTTQRLFNNADELAKMVYNDVIGATTRWRKVMFARLSASENREELVKAITTNHEYRQRAAMALAAIVLPPPHFLPTQQEIQRADLNIEQWLQE